MRKLGKKKRTGNKKRNKEMKDVRKDERRKDKWKGNK